MKFTSRDPETNKERTFENNYEYRIAEFKADNAYNFWDDEVIEYAIEIKNEKIESKCKWSPFNGKKFKGCPVATIIGGKIKVKDGEILGDAEGTPIVFE